VAIRKNKTSLDNATRLQMVKYLADAAYQRFDARRQYEWKVCLGFWAAYLAATGVAVSETWSQSFPTRLVATIVAVPLLLSFLIVWLPGLWEAMENDKFTSRYWEAIIESRIGERRSRHILDPYRAKKSARPKVTLGLAWPEDRMPHLREACRWFRQQFRYVNLRWRFAWVLKWSHALQGGVATGLCALFLGTLWLNPLKAHEPFGIVPFDSASPLDGVLIEDVVEGSPAARSGMKPGDRILRIGDSLVGNYFQLHEALERFKRGDEINITLRRGAGLVVVRTPAP
jgi:PDZ domain-containing protein